jgi:hypothetical protein
LGLVLGLVSVFIFLKKWNLEIWNVTNCLVRANKGVNVRLRKHLEKIKRNNFCTN